MSMVLRDIPKLIDEPTSGLDPIVRDEILDVFLEFIQDERRSIFLSSHIISDLEKVCDYITLLHGGKLIFSEPKDELQEHYGILKCSPQEFERMDRSIVHGYRKNAFCVEALVEKKRIEGRAVLEPASIEQIMLFFVKE